MSTILVNGLRGVSARLFQPWQGAWTCEVDFDLEAIPFVPKGSAMLKIGDALLSGTIDPDASGRFGEKAKARIIGGAGGWSRRVSSRQFHNDGGVTSSAVIAATAAEIGERAIVTMPSYLGVDYLRVAGAASSVLEGLDWYVTTEGVTTVGPRAVSPAPLDVDILEWDPFDQRAELAADVIVSPGTILTDPRFGTVIVRDVEQIFTDGKARATAWCRETAPHAGRLAGLLASAVKSFGGIANLKAYRYRVLRQDSAGRLTLQAISKAAGAPDSMAVPPWFGVPGVKATVAPGTECSVVFLEGDPSKPAVVAFHGADELASGVATQASLAPVFSALTTLLTALGTFVGSAGIATASGGTAAPVAAAATALAQALASPTAFSQRTKLS